MITADFNGDVEARPVLIQYGDVLTLNCTVSGGPANMLHWFKDNVLLQESDEILEFTAIRAADGGLYECMINNTAGNSTANLTIYGMYCLSPT